jgi:hypothetical protein
MKRTSSSLQTIVAGLARAAFGFTFLLLNDPDAPGVEARAALDAAITGSRWLVLFPAAVLLVLWRGVKPWLSGLAMAAGIFVGACAAALAHSSNIWPVAGGYWMIVWTPPILIGSLVGAVIIRTMRS